MSVPATRITLGNTAVVERVQRTDDDGNVATVREDRADLGSSETVYEFPKDYMQDDLDLLAGVHPHEGRIGALPKAQQKFYGHLLAIEDSWYAAHSNDPPEYVECSNSDLGKLIAGLFTTADHPVEVRKPAAGGGDDGPPSDEHARSMFDMDSAELWHVIKSRFLKTNGGVDAFLAQIAGTAAQPAAFNYMALTANSTAASASSTTLTGEITTAGGGLIRAQGAYAHTNGTTTATVTKTFTANGSDSLPVTIAKIGLFNASSSGTLGFETLLNATATLTASGDNVTVTDTITLS